MAKVDKWEGPYTTIPNALAFEKKLSWRAKGIFLYMQAKPHDWDFSSVRMSEDAADGRDATREGIKELIEYGFLIQNKLSSGRYEYRLVEPGPEKPTDGKTHRRNIRPITNKEIKQIKNITNIGETSSPFVWEDYLKDMGKDARREIKIIRAFFKAKDIAYSSKEKAQSSIKRHLRAAKELIAFDDEEIINTMKKLNYDFPKFTIETVLKELTK